MHRKTMGLTIVGDIDRCGLRTAVCRNSGPSRVPAEAGPVDRTGRASPPERPPTPALIVPNRRCRPLPRRGCLDVLRLSEFASEVLKVVSHFG